MLFVKVCIEESILKGDMKGAALVQSFNINIKQPCNMLQYHPEDTYRSVREENLLG